MYIFLFLQAVFRKVFQLLFSAQFVVLLHRQKSLRFVLRCELFYAYLCFVILKQISYDTGKQRLHQYNHFHPKVFTWILDWNHRSSTTFLAHILSYNNDRSHATNPPIAAPTVAPIKKLTSLTTFTQLYQICEILTLESRSFSFLYFLI